MGRREGHDASAFYGRFAAPQISEDSEIARHACRDEMWVADARRMDAGRVADNSVALVVTSPPYYAGKEYEAAVGQGHVPASYTDYLQMLHDVFAECVRKLEPGGRIAVNVANLGRRPYRSLSADVIRILQDELGLLLRGEVIWQKALGAGGNCAWGSFGRPANPVLRDLTERVVIASKGRFDRALRAAERAAGAWPSEGTANADEFMEATTDLWYLPADSATRVGHPAPFPVELPERLIDLYTYRGDLVLDPFMGSGTTAVAAVRTGRHYVGFDTEGTYIELASARVEAERNRIKAGTLAQRWEASAAGGNGPGRLFADPGEALEPRANGSVDHAGSAGHSNGATGEDFQARAVREGRKAQQKARAVLAECGFGEIQEKVPFPGGVEVNFTAVDLKAKKWLFDVSGAFSVSRRPGLRRTDTLWKAIGRAAVLHSRSDRDPLVLLTTNRPAPNTAGQRALEAVVGAGRPVHAVIEMESTADLERLKRLARGNSPE